MNIKVTKEPRGETNVSTQLGVVAGDTGLDHEAGDRVPRSLKLTVGRLLGPVRRASREKR